MSVDGISSNNRLNTSSNTSSLFLDVLDNNHENYSDRNQNTLVKVDPLQARPKISYLGSNETVTSQDIARIIPQLIAEMTPKQRAVLIKLVYAETVNVGGGRRSDRDIENVINSMLWRAVAPFGGKKLFGIMREDGTRSLISVIMARIQYSPLNNFTKKSTSETIEKIEKTPINLIGNGLMRGLVEGSANYNQIDNILTKISNGEVNDRTKGATHYYAPNAANPDWDNGKRASVEEGGHKFFNNIDGVIPVAWQNWQNVRKEIVAKEKSNSSSENVAATETSVIVEQVEVPIEKNDTLISTETTTVPSNVISLRSYDDEWSSDYRD